MADNRARGLDFVRQVVNVVFAVGQVFASFFSDLTGLGVPIGVRSIGGVNPAQPAGYAFGIWGVIFSACIAYAVYQALPGHRTDPLLRRIGPYTAVAFLLTTAWAMLAQFTPGGEPVLTLLLIIIWGVLLWPYAWLARSGPLSTSARALVAFPINILTAWLSVAIFVAIGAVYTAAGGEALGVYVLLVLLAGVAGSTLTLVGRGNPEFPLVIVWGLIGVVAANASVPPYTQVAIVAGTMIVLVLGTLVYAVRQWARRDIGAA